jgi:hypothetical protein
MSMYSDAACCGRADNWSARLNNGYFRGYNGTPPANVAAALAGNTMLIENRFAATAFPAATGHGSTTSNALTVANAVASGTPTFYRGYASDGTTCVVQWNTTDVTISPTSVTAGVSITVNPMVHTEAVGS